MTFMKIFDIYLIASRDTKHGEYFKYWGDFIYLLHISFGINSMFPNLRHRRNPFMCMLTKENSIVKQTATFFLISHTHHSTW